MRRRRTWEAFILRWALREIVTLRRRVRELEAEGGFW